MCCRCFQKQMNTFRRPIFKGCSTNGNYTNIWNTRHANLNQKLVSWAFFQSFNVCLETIRMLQDWQCYRSWASIVIEDNYTKYECVNTYYFICRCVILYISIGKNESNTALLVESIVYSQNMYFTYVFTRIILSVDAVQKGHQHTTC